MDWDGNERRHDTSDHDILIRMETKLTNFLDNCAKQCKDNENHFEKHSKRITTLEKAYWIAIGVIAVLQVILRFVKI